MQDIKKYILKELKDSQVKSDEEIVNNYFRIKKFMWSASAIVKGGSSIIRVLKQLRQKGILKEVLELREDREPNRVGRPSSKIFYKIR